MKAGTRGRRRGLPAALALLAALLLATIGAADAGDSTVTITRDGNRTTIETRDDSWDDYNDTLLHMQRESIAAQEEQTREAGRARRREEIEKQKAASAAEHEAYFDAVMEGSQAALLSPAGVYYRRPGHTSTDGPGGASAEVEVGGVAYLYDQGIFWMQQGARFVVVTAPVGAVVKRLPQGSTRLTARPAPTWYFFGTFFGEIDGGYEVVKPRAGLTVFYLPDGYSQEKVKGTALYRFGDVWYKPLFVQGVLAYQVLETP